MRELADKLTGIEEKLHQYHAKSSQDVLNYRQGIDGQLLGLRSVVESADAGPTDSALARFAELREQLDGHLAELQQLLDTELKAFNERVREKDAPPVFPSKGVDG